MIKEGGLSAPRMNRGLEAICVDAYNLQIRCCPADAAIVGVQESLRQFPDQVSNAQYPYPLDEDMRTDLAAGHARLTRRLHALDGSLSAEDRRIYNRVGEAFQTGQQLLSNTDYLRPVDHSNCSTPQLFANDLSGGGRYPLRTEEHLEASLMRARGWGEWVTRAATNMQEGMFLGKSQPAVVLAEALKKQEALLQPGKLEELLAKPLSDIPDLSDKARQAYLKEMHILVGDGYDQLSTAIRQQILPRARSNSQLGLCHIPGGLDEYDTLLRFWLGRDRQGLQEEMRAGYEETAAQLKNIACRLGHTSVNSLIQQMDNDPSNKPFKSIQEIREHFEGHRELILQGANRILETTPQDLWYAIHMEDSESSNAIAPMYVLGSSDGDRQGSMHVYVGDPTSYPISPTPLHSMHEGFGHHVQILRQQTLPVPKFLRHFAQQSTFREGWAMYVEQFSEAIGFPRDDYVAVHALRRQLSCYRGMYLDLGIHAVGWSWERARQEWRAMGGSHNEAVERETLLRFTAWPGQVGTYNAGNEFSRLLAKARTEVAGFDLRRFNSMLIEEGEMSMSALADRVTSWIALMNRKQRVAV